MKKNTYQKNLELYDKLISMSTEIERKGKSMPYTSANGHMFSQINKDGEIGIRLPKDKREEFLKNYETAPFKSYGAIMKEYVLIPESLLSQLDIVSSYLLEGYNYVNSLKAK
jgi:hypothetical protein